MSDVEIKKALEVCSTGFCISGECPFYDDNDGNDICACPGRLSKAALSLIEKQQEQIEFEKGMRRLAEQDCADRDEMLKQKVEVVYEDFMRDYKLLQEENDGLCKEIRELQAEYGNAACGKILKRKTARDAKRGGEALRYGQTMLSLQGANGFFRMISVKAV